MKCLACAVNELQKVTNFHFSDFDESILNCSGALEECSNCGFGKFSSTLTDEDYSDFYAKECLYSTCAGVGVGGASQEDFKRYRCYLDKILSCASEKTLKGPIVDVGCSRGGFLNFIRKYFEEVELIGVEIDRESISLAREVGLHIKRGNILSLPFKDNAVDIIILSHVLEHIVDFNAALAEISRVLRHGGNAIIEIPDANSYSKSRVGTYFWLGMKEHVNHFTQCSLSEACKRHGLETINVDKTLMPMKNHTSYPSLITIVRRNESLGLDQNIYKYGELKKSHEKSLSEHFLTEVIHWQRIERDLVDIFYKNKGPVTFWGIGLEFFNLVARGLLPSLDSMFLFDSNKKKQSLTVKNLPVCKPSLYTAGSLICCSYLSSQSIINNAMELGWNYKNIYILK